MCKIVAMPAMPGRKGRGAVLEVGALCSPEAAVISRLAGLDDGEYVARCADGHGKVRAPAGGAGVIILTAISVQSQKSAGLLIDCLLGFMVIFHGLVLLFLFIY